LETKSHWYADYDLKPNNVFFGSPLQHITPHARYPKTRIGDFGLAQLFYGYDWKFPVARGTPRFIAPEVMRDSTQHIGPPANVWGIGQIMHSLAVHGQQKGFPEWGKQQRAGDFYSNELEELVAKCLQVDAPLRPTAQELVAATAVGKASAVEIAQASERARVDSGFVDEDPDKLWFEKDDIRNHRDDAYHLWWLPGDGDSFQWPARNDPNANRKWMSGNIAMGLETHVSEQPRDQELR
jgi:serine/threonine protein kinase